MATFGRDGYPLDSPTEYSLGERGGGGGMQRSARGGRHSQLGTNFSVI